MINITKNVIKFNDLEEKMWKKKMQVRNKKDVSKYLPKEVLELVKK